MDKQFMLFSKRKELAEEYEKWVNTPLEDGSKIKDCTLSVITFMQTKGYRKIPENAVVLTREEYDELKQAKTLLEFREETIKHLEDANIRYAESLELKVNKKERKETAEKFARLVEFHSVSTMQDGIEYFTISALGLKEILHEEFGIPYYETCEEITEKGVQNGD